MKFSTYAALIATVTAAAPIDGAAFEAYENAVAKAEKDFMKFAEQDLTPNLTTWFDE